VLVAFCGLQTFSRGQSGRLVTEQVRVEGTVIIADDNVGLFGSAQLLDPAFSPSLHDYCVTLTEGEGGHALKDLRAQLWQEHLVGCDTELAAEEQFAIQNPGSAEAWRLWTRRAAINSAVLAAVFPYFIGKRRCSQTITQAQPKPNIFNLLRGKRDTSQATRRTSEPHAAEWLACMTGEEAASLHLHRVRGNLVLWPSCSLSKELFLVHCPLPGRRRPSGVGTT